MSLPALVGALYFMVSGGPYGLEELAQKVGFGGAIIILLVTPLVWSLPTALMVGELSAALPEEGGYYAWVRRALGPFWGYQEAWLSLTASVFDMAIYPTLFVLYLGRLSPSLAASPLLVAVLVIVVGTGCNLAGAGAVGDGSIAMSVILLAPFAILVLAALFGHPIAGPVASPTMATDRDLAGGLLVAMWNYMGWDNASTIAAEVERPQRSYPIAVLTAVSLVALTYVVPIATMWSARVDPSSWDTGAWVDIARTYGGPALGAAVVVGGMVSAFGMYSALCLSYSRVPAALADDGYLPGVFGRRLKNGVPWVSLLACSLAWSLSLELPFDRLVSLDVLLYGTSLILEFVALVVLRRREPALARPLRVPGGLWGAALLGAGPLVLLGFALTKNVDEKVGPINALVFGAGVMLLGPLAFYLNRFTGSKVSARP